MILADKIINERKRNGWSQEELAEKLRVSRQSVSKWEGAQSVPDLQKVIQMADIFGVSTDYLLKDDQEPSVDKKPVLKEEVTTEPPLRKVSMEEAQEYLTLKERLTPISSLAISLCILCPVVLIFLAGKSEASQGNISENLAAAVGVITLLIMVAIAVVLFMCCDSKMKKFEFLTETDFETEYGVAGMVKERRAGCEAKHAVFNAVGVVLCILCAVPLLISAFLEAEEIVIISMVCVLLIIVAVAVSLFVNGSGVYEACDVLLCEGDYTSEKKIVNKKLRPWKVMAWMIALAIFLGISFTTNRWDRSWIVWPVAAVIYAAVFSAANSICKAKR